jgi:hypothetical protein
MCRRVTNKERAGSAKPATEQRRRVLSTDDSVLRGWGPKGPCELPVSLTSAQIQRGGSCSPLPLVELVHTFVLMRGGEREGSATSSRLSRTAIPRTAPGAKLCLNIASINPPHQLDHPSKMSVRPPRLNFSPPPPRSSKSAEARRVGVLVMPSDAFLCRFLRGGGPPSNPRALACLVPRDSKLAFLLRSLIELSPPPPPP